MVSLLRASMIAGSNEGCGLRTFDDLTKQAVGESSDGEVRTKDTALSLAHLALEVIEIDGSVLAVSRSDPPPFAGKPQDVASVYLTKTEIQKVHWSLPAERSQL